MYFFKGQSKQFPGTCCFFGILDLLQNGICDLWYCCSSSVVPSHHLYVMFSVWHSSSTLSLLMLLWTGRLKDTDFGLLLRAHLHCLAGCAAFLFFLFLEVCCSFCLSTALVLGVSVFFEALLSKCVGRVFVTSTVTVSAESSEFMLAWSVSTSPSKSGESDQQ